MGASIDPQLCIERHRSSPGLLIHKITGSVAWNWCFAIPAAYSPHRFAGAHQQLGDLFAPTMLDVPDSRVSFYRFVGPRGRCE
jgi:hypothetical protein